jgi:chromosome segregation ATPase
MILFIILGGVVLLAVGIVGFLFYLLNKQAPEDSKPSAPQVSSARTMSGSALDLPPLESPLVNDEAVQISREYAEKEAAYQNKVQALEIELNAISQTAQVQSQEALKTIEQLRQENEQLKNEKNNPAVANEALFQAQQTIDTLTQGQESLQSRLSESQEQAHQLQEEVVSIKHQMTQEIVQGKAETERLIADNQHLKNSLEPLIAEATKNLQEEISSLRHENQTLKDAAHAVLNFPVQTPPVVVDTASVEEIAKLQDIVDELKNQIQALKNTNNDLILANQGLKISLESATAEAASAQEETEALKNTFTAASAAETDSTQLTNNNNLILANQRIKELTEQNEHLTERSETLQWDLTKARAQMTSFERACENYQLQLKEALEKKELG